MKKLRRKRMLLQGVSAVCNMGGTWMVVVTVCQIVQSAERETVGGFVVGMLAALAYGLCALLLWSYGLDLAAAARRITRKVARMQAEEKLYNLEGYNTVFKPGAKIAQLVILPIVTPALKLVDKFAETERGDNGFGSTGR